MTWRERINAARARGAFTFEDRKLAESPKTSAYSEIDPRVERDDDGIPLDYPLHILGAQFVDAVCTDKFDKAAELLESIKARATEQARVTELKR
jgi:hypothetical protein